MDTVTLVERRIEDGERLLGRLDQEGFTVSAACWVKPVEEDRWSLYIASPVVEEKGAAAGYREVYHTLRSLGSPWITDSEIKLIGDKHPITKDVLEIVQRYPGLTPTQFHRSLLGGVPVEDSYIYAPTRPRDTSSDLGLRRLKTAVQQRLPLADVTEPYTGQEQHAFEQLIASGMTADQAKYWILKRREKDREQRSIPAGTIVKANYAAWWGDKPENDPNPLLQVEAGDGAQGLTFLDNTEPV